MSRPGAASGPHSRRTTAILCCSTLTYAISQTMVIPGLPAIEAHFRSTPAATGWVMSGFFISSAVCTGIVGRLGDMFGKRRMLVATLATYGCGAVLCALAPTLPLLVVGRVIMGGGGGMVPLAYAIARDELACDRVSKAMGSIAMMIGLGAGLGMVTGGVLVDRVGWPAGFTVAAALTVACVAATLCFVPESPIRSPARVDLLGAALLALGLGSLLFAINRTVDWGVDDARTVLLAGAGLALLVALIRFERDRVQPLLHVPTLVLRPVLFTNVASFTMGAGQVAVSILVVQLAQLPQANGGLGTSASGAGLLIVPYSLTMVVGSQLAGRTAGRVGGHSLLMGGALLAGAGLVGLAVTPTSLVALAALAAVSGLGISMTLVAAPLLLATHVDRARTGEANGTNTIARAVGQSVGTQVSTAVLAATAVAGAATAHGFRVAFVLSAVACTGGGVASRWIGSHRQRPDPDGPGGRTPDRDEIRPLALGDTVP